MRSIAAGISVRPERSPTSSASQPAWRAAALQEAAVRLKITEGTARQRLVPIFEKTGTARQSALVRLVQTGPESLIGDE